MRRIVEGNRVHQRIQEMMRNKRQGEPATAGVARQSDIDKLEEFDAEVKSARSN